jgi:DNA-binding IclR family transcriptional regulator
MTPPDADPGAIKTVVKIGRIFDLLAAHHEGLGVTEIARRLGWKKSSVHGLLKSLVAGGLLTRTAAGGYDLGLRLLQYGNLAAGRHDLVVAVRPWAERLAFQLGQLVHTAVLLGRDVVVIHSLRPMNRFIAYPEPGLPIPAHASAPGKTLLAFLPEDEARAVLAAGPLPAYTPATITDVARLLAQFREIRARGFAVDDEEILHTQRGIAAPILGATGSAVAAICVHGDVDRVNPAHADTVAAVRYAAAAIGEAIGHREPPAERRGKG